MEILQSVMTVGSALMQILLGVTVALFVIAAGAVFLSHVYYYLKEYLYDMKDEKRRAARREREEPVDL